MRDAVSPAAERHDQACREEPVAAVVVAGTGTVAAAVAGTVAGVAAGGHHV